MSRRKKAPTTSPSLGRKNVRAARRCDWGKAFDDPLYRKYHDREWGAPVHDDRKLFELLILEGMQAGLSWATVLRKRGNFRRAFDGFDARKIARYGPAEVRRLMKDAGIIRNRLKIAAAVANARAFLEVRREFGTFSAYIWKFVEGKPRQNRWISVRSIPARTAASDALSKDLRDRGFRFVGSTICYAFMQSVGLVNDHTLDCFRYREVQGKKGRL